MKKLLLFFVTLFTLITLASCSPSTALLSTVTPTVGTTVVPVSPTLTATPVDIEIDPGKLKGIQIFFMHPWTGGTAILMDSLVSEFNRTNTWGIQVNLVAPGSDGSLMSELLADMQTSVPPEVIAAPIDELLALNRNSQTVVDLNPYVNSEKWGIPAADIQSYAPVFWTQDEVDGYRYGIAAQRTAKVMIYNKTWATELGFTTPPTTPEEFKTQVCAANASLKLDNTRSNDGLGGWVVDTDAMTMTSWAVTFQTQLDNDNKIRFATPKLVQSFTYLRDLLDKGCAWNSKDTAPYPYFANRQTLVYSADLQDLSQQQLAQQIAGSSDEWMVIPFPTADKTFVLTQGPSYAMLNTTPEKQLAAWLFIRWMSAKDHNGALVKASSTLPLGNEFINYSIELEDSIPQWKQAVALLPFAQITPVNANWPKAKMIFEDAAWQLFKTEVKVDQIPALTQEMDATLAELVGKGQ
ncbi:MAG: extracellular solute-binding protein [Anaerolineaceae bacterium]